MAAVRFEGLKRARVPALIGAVLVALLALVWWQLGEPHYFRMVLESPLSGKCERRLTRDVLQRSLSLQTQFLRKHQRPEGNFDYEYDFSSQQLSSDDNEVRQAGALWGLVLAYAHEPNVAARDVGLRAQIERGLAFFEEHSRQKKGRRCIAYPGASQGSTGTVALVALSHIDYLRAAPPELTAEARDVHRARLAGYLRQLERSLRPDGLWHSQYDVKGCAAQGEASSSYADGEALLALVKAAKYLGFSELEPTLLRAADAGRKLNIEAALAADPDSDVTKGYYQWSSMAFYELATSNIQGGASYGDTVLRLADWMIDEHDTLWRLRNTGYAYEGIIHAHALAEQRNDSARLAKYGCVIDVGLNRLLSWQVGGPLGSDFANRGQGDPLALGGVQNEVRNASLRIDVTQHQAHATLLALRHVYRK
jgi:UDP-N-acetylmuramoyl-tripeptide--D-alanyl-D-alanine ligase